MSLMIIYAHLGVTLFFWLWDLWQMELRGICDSLPMLRVATMVSTLTTNPPCMFRIPDYVLGFELGFGYDLWM